MSLSVFALAVVVSVLPRRYGCVVAVSAACALGGFGLMVALAEVSPTLSGVAFVVGSSASGSAVLVTVVGLDAALSFVPAEFYGVS